MIVAFLDGGDRVLLKSGGDRLVLPRADVARYSDGRATFWAGDGRAVLALDPTRTMVCRAEPDAGSIADGRRHPASGSGRLSGRF